MKLLDVIALILIIFLQVKNEFGFEPYVAVPSTNVLLYQEILIERMRDKLLYTEELEMAGYNFYIVN